MEIHIGVVHTAKELTVEVEGSADEIVSSIDKAMADGASVFWLTDSKGRRVGVPSGRIAYIKLDEDGSGKRVGFGR